MKTYARIEAGTVAELFSTEADPAILFHPALRWVEVQAPPVAVGWVEAASGLVPPPPSAAPPPPSATPTIADLHQQIMELSAKVAALAPH